MNMRKLQIGDLCARIPVVQGGMGVGVSLGGLAGAVAAEGGMGVISTAQIGFLEPDFVGNELECNLRGIRRQIAKAKSRSATFPFQCRSDAYGIAYGVADTALTR